MKEISINLLYVALRKIGNSLFQYNVGPPYGLPYGERGSIAFVGGSNLTFTGCEFVGNSFADQRQGAYVSGAVATVTVGGNVRFVDCLMIGNAVLNVNVLSADVSVASCNYDRFYHTAWQGLHFVNTSVQHSQKGVASLYCDINCGFSIDSLSHIDGSLGACQ